MSRFTLTIRHGPKVDRERFDSIDAAVDAMKAHAARIRAAGELPEVSALRTFGPEEQVNARLEISSGRLLGGREVGVDVMGNGAIVPYRGGAFKRKLDPDTGDSPYDAVAAALRR